MWHRDIINCLSTEQNEVRTVSTSTSGFKLGKKKIQVADYDDNDDDDEVVMQK